MGRKVLALSLVLVMALSFAGCEEPSAEEIVASVIESLDDVRTYQFDMDMTMDMAGEFEGEAMEVVMTMDGTGAIDVENSQMMMDMDITMTMPEELDVEMGMEMYLIGDTMYMMMEMPTMGSMWMKSEMPAGSWAEMNQVESQIALLEAAQVEYAGSEKVDGVNCYVIQYTPDMEQLWDLFSQQAGLGMGGVPDVEEEFLQDLISSFSVKQWFAKDTYFLVKAEIGMVMELTPEAMGFPEEEGVLNMDIAMSMLTHDYNQPVSIILPPEAETAEEMPWQY
ncbi:MAG: hypothetical protein E3J67_02435 [Dehalococcoidia bacterium]|nr:MAG: hypothetical protein E3J67_02435 [Dehalococcoidia bacterium]